LREEDALEQRIQYRSYVRTVFVVRIICIFYMLNPIGNILGDALNRRDVQQGIRTAVLLDAAREAIEAVLGSNAANQTQPVAYKNFTLFIQVPHGALAQEIRLKEKEIIHMVEERRGKGVVKFIKIRVSRQVETDMLT